MCCSCKPRVTQEQCRKSRFSSNAEIFYPEKIDERWIPPQSPLKSHLLKDKVICNLSENTQLLLKDTGVFDISQVALWVQDDIN